MALPSVIDQLKLNNVILGTPKFNVSASTAVVSDGIHFIINGVPDYAMIHTSDPVGVSYDTAQMFAVF